MGLRDILRRIRRRPPSGESVELRPADQVALAHLLRFESASLETIGTVLEGRGWAVTPDAGEAMTRLVAFGLAEARYQPEGGGAVFVVTAKARRLAGRIPGEPRTVTEFWL
jgi:hypothetical protein